MRRPSRPQATFWTVREESLREVGFCQLENRFGVGGDARLFWIRIRFELNRSEREMKKVSLEKQKAKGEEIISPRVLNLGLPLDRFGANLIRFDGVARRGDQEVGEEGGGGFAVAGQGVRGYGCCSGWYRGEGDDVRGLTEGGSDPDRVEAEGFEVGWLEDCAEVGERVGGPGD